MKKIFAILLTLAMVISMFAGCDSGHDHNPTTEPSEVITDHTGEVVTDPTIDKTEVPAETTVPETEAPTEAPTEPEATECKHDYEKTVVAPTQSAQGYTLYKCKKCGDEYKSDYTAKLPSDDKGDDTHQHNYSTKVTAPTCTAKGYTTYTCPCGHSYKSDEKSALGHDWDNGKVTKTATCSAEGVKTYTCERNGCGKTKTETIAKTGHNWGDWMVTKEATTEAEGEETRTCGNCGKTETRKTDKLPVDDGGNNGDGEGGYYIDLMGNKVYWNCSAQGHLSKDSKGTIIQEASCCTECIVQYECKVIGCGKTWTEVTVPVTGCHVMSDADRAKITRGDTLYRIRCRCGHGIYQYTHDAAMAAWEAHAAENLYIEPSSIQEHSIEHSHSFPGGTFVCVNCKQEFAFNESYADCNGEDCRYD